MKKILLLLSLLTPIISFTQPMSPQASPNRQVGWTINEGLSNLQKTSDGGIIGCNSSGTKKYSEAGVIVFSLPFAFKTLIPTSDGGYLLGVNTNSAQTSLTSYYGLNDIWIVKINSLGVVSWQRSLSGSGDDILESMKLTTNNELIVLLSSNSSDYFGAGNQGGKDLWLVHLSNIGTQTKINLGGTSDETFKNLELISSTESLVCLTTSSQNGVFNQGYKGNLDTWMLKITKGVTLSIAQKRAYGGFNDDDASLYVSNQKYLLAGYSKSSNGDLSNNKGQKDIWICFINPDGTLISSNNYGGSSDDFVRDAFFNSTDNAFYILCDNNSVDGDFPNPSGGSVQDRLFKFNNVGGFLWRRDFYVQRPFGVIPSMVKIPNESGFIISGVFDSSTSSNPTNLFTASIASVYTSTFFCKLNSTDGSTAWYRQPSYGRNVAYISIQEKLSNGNILCSTISTNSSRGNSKIFTINSQGIDVEDNFTYPCPVFSFSSPYPLPQIYCIPPPMTAIAGNNGVIFTQYHSSSAKTQKVCPQVYAGITRQYKIYCNSTIGDTVRVPDDNRFNYQWKRNGIPIIGANLAKHFATQTGKYTVEISGKNCIGKAETDTIVLAMATIESINPIIQSITDTTICLGDTAKMKLIDGCNFGFLQWQRNGNDIAGETSLTYNTTQDGVYRVKVTTSGSVSYTNTKTISLNTECCIMKSIAQGNWESPSTWSCNRTPLDTDIVLINGHDVTITTNTAQARKIIYNGGRIYFINTSAKLFIKENP